MLMMSSRDEREATLETYIDEDDLRFLMKRRLSDTSDISNNMNIAHKKSSSKRSSKRSFPVTLFKLLEDADQQGYAQIISWLPSGDAFQIHNTSRFCADIMTKFFRQTKLDSFTRQLYIYGFSKDTNSKTAIGEGPIFFHPKFRRGDVGACTSIERNRSGDRRLKKNMSEGTIRKETGKTEVGSSTTSVIELQHVALMKKREDARKPPPSMAQPQDRTTRIPSIALASGPSHFNQGRPIVMDPSHFNQGTPTMTQQLGLRQETDGNGDLNHWDLEPRTIEEMMSGDPL
eukprot:scaffold692_cov118-Cylindrotheca_fusiformis.AAC.9